MMNSQAKRVAGPAVEDDAHRLQRLEFEMALEIGEAGGRSFYESLQSAADVAGGEILFVLPAAGGKGATGLLRLMRDGKGRFVQVRTGDAGFTILEDEAIDAGLLGFARASIDVLERLRADRAVIAPLAASAH